MGSIGATFYILLWKYTNHATIQACGRTAMMFTSGIIPKEYMMRKDSIS